MIKKQTIRIEEKEYQKIKIILIKKGYPSFQEYILDLILKDLNLSKKTKRIID